MKKMLLGGLWFGALLSLTSCSPPYVSPFISPHDKVSGGSGTVWFVSAYRLRDCNYIECGEKGSEYLGRIVSAYLLHRGKEGRLEWTLLDQRTCDADHLEDCDEVEQNVENTGVGQVLVALSDTPLAQTDCTSLAELPHANIPDHQLYLTDAVRDREGRLHIAYVSKNGPLGWEDAVYFFATFDDAWQFHRLERSDLGDLRPPSISPGFLDAQGDEVILAEDILGNSVDVLLYSRAQNRTTLHRTILPSN